VHALARGGEPVIGRPEIAEDADLESRFLFDLAERGVLDLFALIGSALGAPSRWRRTTPPAAIASRTREDRRARIVGMGGSSRNVRRRV